VEIANSATGTRYLFQGSTSNCTVLAICSAGAYEQSFADAWSNELGVWMCDRFSRNLIGYATEYPDGTYRDLYLYCARHTLGSHVGIYNYTNFGNLYTTGPKDFFVKK
jgi:hypothetical protein